MFGMNFRYYRLHRNMSLPSTLSSPLHFQFQFQFQFQLQSSSSTTTTSSALFNFNLKLTNQTSFFSSTATRLPNSFLPSLTLTNIIHNKRNYELDPSSNLISASLLENPIIWAARLCVFYALLKAGLAGSQSNPIASELGGGMSENVGMGFSRWLDNFRKLQAKLTEADMGQILDKVQGKEWRKKQIMKITDKVYNRVKTQTGRSTLSFEELYIAALLVYNDINKYLPGPHFDPPSKDEIRTLMKECDMNLDGEIDHEEFVKFVQKLTANTFSTVSQGLIIALVLAPTVALATKRATEGVPGIGKVVQKVPNSIYASLVTIAVVAIQNALE